MKTIKIIFSIILIFFSIKIFAQEESIEPLLIPLSNPGYPGFLIVNHEKGSINVSSYDSEAVLINATLRQRKKVKTGNAETEGMKRISSNYYQLQAQEENNKVIVIFNTKGKTYDLDIKVPYRFSLQLETRDNGKITVNNVTGEMEIKNYNGSINLNEISGSAVVNTLDGNIIVTFVEITPDIPMAFTTLDGKIDVTFPPGIKALAKMKTEEGDIYTDFDMKIEERKAKVEKSDKTRIYKVSLDEWIHGKINGDSPEMLFKTFDGNIYIRKRK